MPYIIVAAFWVTFIVTLLTGYVMNIFDLIGMVSASATFGLEAVLRIIGVFVAPLGALMGFFA
jgi:hypothetical protein